MQHFGEFVVKHWDLFLALFVILGLIISRSFGGRMRGYGEVDPVEAVQKMNHEEAVLVDVREDNEYRDGHVVDSIHIPLGSLGSRVESLEKYREKPIIVACRSGARSARACATLRKEGFEQVFNLRGGVMAWQSAKLPLNKGGKKRKR